MNSIFTLILIFLILSSMILLINSILSMKKKMNREKNTPFECGFDPMTSSQLPFSIQFFLISLMFLIFDIEIALLLPSILMIKMKITMHFLLTFLFFSIMLIFSTYYEWSENNINWMN